MANLIACKSGRTGYATEDEAAQQLATIKRTARHANWNGEVRSCDQCEGFHVVQPKKSEHRQPQ